MPAASVPRIIAIKTIAKNAFYLRAGASFDPYLPIHGV
jgi:hypothetical protein